MSNSLGEPGSIRRVGALTRICVVSAIVAAGFTTTPISHAATAVGDVPHRPAHRHAASKHAPYKPVRHKLRPHSSPTRHDAGSRADSAAQHLSGSAKAQRAVQFALAQLGKPYSWGGNGPGAYDCAGLTQQAWRAAGIRIPRMSQDQARTGTAVPPNRMRPGDLVIFYGSDSHVGLYLGDGLVIVSSHPGSGVQIMPMSWMPVSTIRRIA